VAAGVAFVPAMPVAHAATDTAQASTASSVRVQNRTCSTTVHGRTVRISFQLTWESSRGSGADDLRRVAVRTTDQDASGIFRNSHVDLRELRVAVFTRHGGLTLADRGDDPSVAYRLDSDDRDSGKDVTLVKAEVWDRVNGHREHVTCNAHT
jgi:hypothetical protein